MTGGCRVFDTTGDLPRRAEQSLGTDGATGDGCPQGHGSAGNGSSAGMPGP